MDDAPTHDPQPSTKKIGFVVRSTIAGQCVSALEGLLKIDPPAKFDLSSKLLNSHTISRKSGRGEDVRKRKAEKEVQVMMKEKRPLTSVARALKLRLMGDELIVRFLMEWTRGSRTEIPGPGGGR